MAPHRWPARGLCADVGVADLPAPLATAGHRRASPLEGASTGSGSCRAGSTSTMTCMPRVLSPELVATGGGVVTLSQDGPRPAHGCPRSNSSTASGCGEGPGCSAAAANSTAAAAAACGGGRLEQASAWRSVSTPSWAPSVPYRQLQKGIVSFGAPGRARRVAAKLLTGQPVSLVFLGGSIT